jgi:hypothetical protein
VVEKKKRACKKNGVKNHAGAKRGGEKHGRRYLQKQIFRT